MHELASLYQKTPNTSRINLMFMNLRDITQITGFLSKFKQMQQLSLHGNKITYLPSLQSLTKLRILDISNNQIKIDNDVLDNLYKAKQLRQLFIDCNKEQQKIIVQNLPNLININGQPIIRPIIHKQTLQNELQILEQKLQTQIQHTKRIYTRMLKMTKQNKINSPKSEDSFANQNEKQFDFLFKEIKEEMRYFYSGLQDKLSSQGVFAYCKNKLTILYDNLIIKLLDQLGNQTVTRVYQEVSKIKSQNFQTMLKIIFKTSYQQYIDEQFKNSNNTLRKQTLYQNQIFKLKKQILELKQNKLIKSGRQHKEEDHEKVIQDKFKEYKLQKYFQKEKQRENYKVNMINNVVFGSTPRSIQKSLSKQNLRKEKDQIIKNGISNKNMSKSPSNSNMKVSPSYKNLNRSSSKSNINKMNRTISSKNIQGPLQQIQPPNIHPNQQSKNNPPPKISNLDQLLRLIQQIMTQKRKDNTKNFTKKQIFSTAEQFMYIYFSRRYGMKQIALQWSLALIKAIETYHKQSIEVQVFAKILKNSMYEQYYDQIKKFDKEIDKYISSYPTRRIDQNYFYDIFRHFFEIEQDSLQKISKNVSYPMNIMSLHHVLQSYKLGLEDKYMNGFRIIFGQLDQDDDGCLNMQELKQMVTKVCRNNRQMDVSEQDQNKESLFVGLNKVKKDRFIFSEVFHIVHHLL